MDESISEESLAEDLESETQIGEIGDTTFCSFFIFIFIYFLLGGCQEVSCKLAPLFGGG